MYILQSFALPADSRTSAPRGSLLQEPFASVQASNIQASNTHVMQHKYINIQIASRVSRVTPAPASQLAVAEDHDVPDSNVEVSM